MESNLQSTLAVRKPRDSESIQSVDTVRPREQKYPEKEVYITPSFDAIDEEKLKREAADWFQATMTGEMDDQPIERAIMDFCTPSRPAESEEITQPERVEKPPDQAAPLRRKLKESPRLQGSYFLYLCRQLPSRTCPARRITNKSNQVCKNRKDK